MTDGIFTWQVLKGDSLEGEVIRALDRYMIKTGERPISILVNPDEIELYDVSNILVKSSEVISKGYFGVI